MLVQRINHEKCRGGMALAASLALLAGSPPTAGAHRVTTFHGSCDFSLVVTFDPPLTNTARPTDQVGQGDGHCTGTLTRGKKAVHLDRARAAYFAESHADAETCASSAAEGPGYLDLGGSRLRFDLTEQRLAASVDLTLTGRAGGSMDASGTPTDDPVATVAKCAGSGLDRAHVDVSGQTDPTISG